MRVILPIVLVFAVVAFVVESCARGPDGQPAGGDDKPKFVVGDAAPPLKADVWLNGPAAPAFAPGKVYVVDFWATWCGPCLAMMPHLGELQEKYKGDGLVVVAATVADDSNPMPRIEAYVKKVGGRAKVPFAVFNAPDVQDAYMTGTGWTAFPASFVIDRNGKLAYFGDAGSLDDVLPKVLAGKWRGQADQDDAVKKSDEFNIALAEADDLLGTNPAAGAKAVAALAEKYPARSHLPIYRVELLRMLLKGRRYDDAKALSESLTKQLADAGLSGLLQRVRVLWLDPGLNPTRTHANQAVAAAEAALAVDGATDPAALFGAAEAYIATQNKPAAVEIVNKAVDASPTDAAKADLRAQWVGVLLRVGDVAEAKDLTEKLIPPLTAAKLSEPLARLRNTWVAKSSNPARKHPELGVAAADAVVQIDVDDPDAYTGAAEASLAAGDKPKAFALAAKAVEFGKTDGAKAGLEAYRVGLLLRADEVPAAKELTEKLIPIFVEGKQTVPLNQLREHWLNPNLNPGRVNLNLAVAAGEAMLKVEGDQKPGVLFRLAEAYHAVGQNAKAAELAEKAIPLVETDDERRLLKRKVQEYKAAGRK